MRTKKNQTFSSFTKELGKKLEVNGQIRTGRAYQTAIRRLLGFVEKEELHFADLDSGMMNRFQTFLLDSGRAMNTVSFYMRQLRSVYNQAVDVKAIKKKKEDIFDQVFTGNALTNKRALDIEEMSSLANLEIVLLPQEEATDKQSKRARKQRNELYESQQYLLFSFHGRGISFVDLCHLRKTNIRNGEIHYCRKKTRKELVVKISEPMQKILDYFNEKTKESPYLFPLLNACKSNIRRQYENALRKQNKLLKEIAKMANLSSPLSTHVARHSWATIAYHKGISVNIISQALGHQDEKTTTIYLASFGESVINQVSWDVSKSILKEQRI